MTAYTRNPLGQVTQVANPNVTYTYTYDAAHRLQTVTDSRGPKTLTYSYSPGALRNAMTDSDGNRTTYLYDGLGRLTGLRAPTGDLTAFAYDPGGRLRGKTFANGVTTRYTYNADNTLARLVNRVGLSDSSMISQHDYTYDGVGNRITHLERIGATTTPYAYTYDPLDRLIQVTGGTTESYAYDPLGNRITKTSGSTLTCYAYDGANQLTQLWTANPTCATPPSPTFTYDLNGNMISRTDGPATTMAYDAENRLAWIGVANQLEQSYAYDAHGRRVRKTVGGTTTQYLYDGQDIIAEYSTWAAPTARTTHGLGTDDPLLRTTATGTQYFHQDGLGSVIGVSNQTGGTDGTVRYDAWGNQTLVGGTAPAVYGYTGREPDETGLIYYRARYYDPTLGRFTQRDPIGLDGGLNAYAYVAGNPINLTDALGLLPTGPTDTSSSSPFTLGGSPLQAPFHADSLASCEILCSGSQSLRQLSWGERVMSGLGAAAWLVGAGYTGGQAFVAGATIAGLPAAIGLGLLTAVQLDQASARGWEAITGRAQTSWVGQALGPSAESGITLGLALTPMGFSLGSLTVAELRTLGRAGSNPAIREVVGAGVEEAGAFFDKITQGAKPLTDTTYPGLLMELQGGGRAGLRLQVGKPPTIDLHYVPGLPSLFKIKFLRGG